MAKNIERLAKIQGFSSRDCRFGVGSGGLEDGNFAENMFLCLAIFSLAQRYYKKGSYKRIVF